MSDGNDWFKGGAWGALWWAAFALNVIGCLSHLAWWATHQ
jgi:hypothetical protein